MDQKLKSKTYFNLASVPILFLVGFLGIGMIDGMEVEHQTDQMFDDRLGYGIMLILALVIAYVVWMISVIALCIKIYAYKTWFFLNLLSITWLPLFVIGWYVKQQIPIYFEKSEFVDKIENQVEEVVFKEVELNAAEPILVSHIFNDELYILTGEDLRGKGGLQTLNQEMLLCPTLKHPLYMRNLQVFKLDQEEFVEQKIDHHTLFESIYKKNIRRTTSPARAVKSDSIPTLFYQLSQPSERCLFPLNISDQSYIYKACDPFEIKLFHKDFMLYMAKSVENSYEDLLEGKISDFNKNFWKTMSYIYSYERSDGQFYSYVSPHGYTKNTKKAALDLWRDGKETYLYIARKDKRDHVAVKKIGSFSTEPFIQGIYATQHKVYIILNQKLIVINDF